MSHPPKTYAIFMRHGAYEQPEDVPSAWLPYPLTSEGRRQAAAAVPKVRAQLKALGASLAPVVHASSLLRAVETARGFIEAFGRDDLELVTTPDLKERGLGSMANLRVSEIEDIASRDPRVGPLPSGWKSAAHFRLPYGGAESLSEAGARVASYVERVVRVANQSARVSQAALFVGHGAAFRHAAVTLGVLELSQVRGLSMHHCDPLVVERIEPGAWRHVSGAWKVRTTRVGGGD